MDVIELVKECLRKLGARDISVTEGDTVDFTLEDIPAFAYAQQGGRLRGSVWLHLPYEGDGMPADAVLGWVDQQELPKSCRLEAVPTPDDPDSFLVRVVFERPLEPGLISPADPLRHEAAALFDAWPGDGARSVVRRSDEWRFEPQDPYGPAPTNAWLLTGGEDSYFEDEYLEEILEDAAVGIFEAEWTVSKQTEAGDLLFIYFTEPRKAIHFVTRAVDSAYFADIGETDARWAGRQWWCHIAPPVQIQPISLAELERVTGKNVMRGRSGRYVRPEHVGEISSLIRPLNLENQTALSRILQPVTGRDHHPDPSAIDLSALRSLASGSLGLEQDVERFVVEPILRFIIGPDAGYSVQQRYRIARRIADYAVLAGDHPQFVVEAKLRIRYSRDGKWGTCKDFAQALHYADSLDVPGLLIDAVELHVVMPGTHSPVFSRSRRDLTEDDITRLRELLLDHRGGG